MKSFFNDYFKWFWRLSSIYVILILSSLIHLNYYIYMPGNLTDIKKEIIVEDARELNGSISSVYVVTTTKPTIIEYLIAKNLKYSSVVRMTESEVINLDTKLDTAIGVFDSNRSFSDAELSAYSILNSDSDDYYRQVTYIYSATKDVESNMAYTKLVGKLIKSMGDGEIFYPKMQEVKDYLSTIEIGSYASFTLEDKNKNTYDVRITKRDNGNSSGVFGITLMTSFELLIETKTKVQNVSTEGPSGGAMQALYIYLSSIDEDLLKGRRVAGTGTIGYAFDELGNIASFSKVGSIGCVEQKLYAAYLDKAEIFYCPKGNYADCMKAYELYGFTEKDIRVVEVSYLDDIIQDLRGESK